MMTLRSAVKRFELACEADGLAPKTVGWYRANLEQLVKFAGERSIGDISCDDLRAFVVQLRKSTTCYESHPTRPPLERALSASTINGYIRTLKRFFAWAVKEGLVETSPAHRLRLPRNGQAIPKGIFLKDLKKLLAATAGPQKTHRRNQALLLLLADTGCRASEICGLRTQEVDLEAGLALVRGKGSKDRLVAFCPKTGGALRAWLEVRPLNSCDAVFTGERGPLTTSGLAQVLRRLGKEVGIESRCNPHSFRHGFAREYLMNGGDLASLSDLLGHADIVVTKMYSVFRVQELQAKHSAHSPVSRLES